MENLLGLACTFGLVNLALSIPCPPGEYFPHPLNCEDFYLCDLDGNPKPFSCPQSLHFNPTTDCCDWPVNAKCSVNNTDEIGVPKTMNQSTAEGEEHSGEVSGEESSKESFFDVVKEAIFGVTDIAGASEGTKRFESGEHSNPSEDYVWNDSSATEVEDQNDDEKGDNSSETSRSEADSGHTTDEVLIKRNKKSDGDDVHRKKRDTADSATKIFEGETESEFIMGSGEVYNTGDETSAKNNSDFKLPIEESDDLKLLETIKEDSNSNPNEDLEITVAELISKNEDEEIHKNPFHFSMDYENPEVNPVFYLYSVNDTENSFGKVSGYLKFINETIEQTSSDDNIPTNVSLTVDTGKSTDGEYRTSK